MHVPRACFSSCVYAYVYVYVYAFTYAYAYAYVYAYWYAYAYVYAYVCLRMCMCRERVGGGWGGVMCAIEEWGPCWTQKCAQICLFV
jgi:hypothetical protein